MENINQYNFIIFLGSISLFLLAAYRLVTCNKTRKTEQYFYWFLLVTAIAINQYILYDIGVTKKYPIVLLFFFPLEFLAPVIFTGFTYSYLKREKYFKKVQYYLLIPFVFFVLLYTLVKINVFYNYSFISKQNVSFFHTEINENSALLFSLFIGVWNYIIINNYEKSMAYLPYNLVVKKTKWLKKIYAILIFLSFFWLITMLHIKTNEQVSGNDTYYPLWIAYICCYFGFYFFSTKHFKEETTKESIKNVNLSGLSKIYDFNDLKYIEQNQFEILAILSYFATSLYDKHKTKDVLWDIVENCISKLNLEDCVIYMLDKKKQVLVQQAAYGNKLEAKRKILSPIQIPLGKGIVGTVAKTGKYELLKNTSKDKRYVVDDLERNSELAVPIIVNDIVIGVLDSEHSHKNFFTFQHLQLFQLIAKLTATKITQLTQKNRLSITNDNAYFKEVCSLMEEEKLYRNPEIKLTSIANQINISSNYLSQLINTITGSNFSDFVNGYRIKEAKLKLVNTAFINYPILSIGLESGFNSKSAFYSSFKKNTGMSPNEYREKHR